MLRALVKTHTELLILGALIVSGYLVVFLDVGAARDAPGGRVGPEVVNLAEGAYCHDYSH